MCGLNSRRIGQIPGSIGNQTVIPAGATPGNNAYAGMRNPCCKSASKLTTLAGSTGLTK